ncbi:MAG: thermonuclease family protein [Gammaproteobacteria bacterium]|nr:thermonuclease family protein [Gammaproteobacteria bacterium]
MKTGSFLKRALVGALFAFLGQTINADGLLDCAQRPAASKHTVRTVIDGDTVILENRTHVRLAGINSPELGKKGVPAEPLAKQARDRLTALVENKAVMVQSALETRDHYGRTLAYLTLTNGQNVQETLVREGLAVTVAVSPNTCELKSLQSAENMAKNQRRGVWANSYFSPREAKTLETRDTGFRFVKGTIQKISNNAKMIRLELDDQVVIGIPGKFWPLFSARPEDFLGKTVVVRGWLTHQDNDRLLMVITHPYMLSWLDVKSR